MTRYIAAGVVLGLACYVFGVLHGLSWWADRCEAGDMVKRNGMVYDCRAYQAPKVRKGT